MEMVPAEEREREGGDREGELGSSGFKSLVYSGCGRRLI